MNKSAIKLRTNYVGNPVEKKEIKSLVKDSIKEFKEIQERENKRKELFKLNDITEKEVKEDSDEDQILDDELINLFLDSINSIRQLNSLLS